MKENRDKSIYVRVSEKEKRKLVATAKKCGLTLSEYLRQIGLGYEPKELFVR